MRTESKPDPQKQLMIKVKACQRYDELLMLIYITSVSLALFYFLRSLLSDINLLGIPCIILPTLSQYKYLYDIDLSKKPPIMKRN